MTPVKARQERDGGDCRPRLSQLKGERRHRPASRRTARTRATGPGMPMSAACLGHAGSVGRLDDPSDDERNPDDDGGNGPETHQGA